MISSSEQLRSTVISIANDLDAAVAGNLYVEDDEFFVIYDMDEWKHEKYMEMVEKFKKEHPEKDGFDKDEYETYEEFMEDEIGTEDDIDEPEQASIYDYVEKQSLGDTRFEIDSSGALCGGRILFCYGGPTIWVHDDRVCGYWGNDSWDRSLDSDTASALFSMMEEELDRTLEIKFGR